MNAIGPIETKAKAKAALIRARFMPTDQQLREMRAIERLEARERIERQRADALELRQHERPGKNIIRQVAKKHKVAAKEIVSRSRRRPVVHARQEVMYRISNELKYSLNHVADILNRADHTTVIHGLRAHEERMERANG